MEDYIKAGKIKLPLKIFFEKRNNSRVSIGKQAVHIRIPQIISEHEKDRQINKFRDWARKKLLKHMDRYEKKPLKIYHDGDTLKVGRNNFRLHLVFKDKKTSSAKLDGKDIYLSISKRLTQKDTAEQISALISRNIGRKLLPDLKKRITFINNKYFNAKIGKIHYKYNKSNWGSCSARGNINISTRLLFAPPYVLDYVCIHEIAHIFERNHSKRFWAIVAKAAPNYKKIKQWLKEHNNSLSF